MVKEIRCDLIVIGGGAAGLAAAAKAKRLGVGRVILVDSSPYMGRLLGGILPQCIHPGFGLQYFKEELTGPEFAERLVKQVYDLGVEMLTESYASDLRYSEDNVEVTAISPKGVIRLDGKALIYAAGARERSIFEIGVVGYRPAGVFTAGETQALMDLFGVMPGKEMVIIGSGDVGLIMARRFALEGADVKAVVELMPWPGGLTRNVVQCLEDFGIPLLLSHMVTKILGRRRVAGVEVVKVNEDLKPVSGTEKVLECDTVVVAAGIVPKAELLEEAGALIDRATHGPIVNDFLETTLHNVFAAGNALIINDLVDHAAEQGERAAESVAYILEGGEIPHEGVKKVVLGRNVRLAMPQRVTGLKDVYLHVRVKKPEENVRLVVRELGLEVKMPRVRPAEMIRLPIRRDRIAAIGDSKLTVSVEAE